MSYIDLKHLLASLALEAVRNPAEAGWLAVAAACAEFATVAQPRVPWSDCLKRAAILAAPHGWMPGEADIRRLISRGLFSDRGDLIVLPDRFLPHLAYFQRHAPRALNAVAELQGADISPEVPNEIRVGAALFSAGLFFECHEWFEGLWKAAEGERKEFYHGIVQAAAAFYHYEKNNMHGCRTLLRKGRRRLASCPDWVVGIDLAQLQEDLVPWAAHFEGGPRPDDYPGIHLLPPKHARKRLKGAPRG